MNLIATIAGAVAAFLVWRKATTNRPGAPSGPYIPDLDVGTATWQALITALRSNNPDNVAAVARTIMGKHGMTVIGNTAATVAANAKRGALPPALEREAAATPLSTAWVASILANQNAPTLLRRVAHELKLNSATGFAASCEKLLSRATSLERPMVVYRPGQAPARV